MHSTYRSVMTYGYWHPSLSACTKNRYPWWTTVVVWMWTGRLEPTNDTDWQPQSLSWTIVDTTGTAMTGCHTFCHVPVGSVSVVPAVSVAGGFSIRNNHRTSLSLAWTPRCCSISVSTCRYGGRPRCFCWACCRTWSHSPLATSNSAARLSAACCCR